MGGIWWRAAGGRERKVEKAEGWEPKMRSPGLKDGECWGLEMLEGWFGGGDLGAEAVVDEERDEGVEITMPEKSRPRVKGGWMWPFFGSLFWCWPRA